MLPPFQFLAISPEHPCSIWHNATASVTADGFGLELSVNLQVGHLGFLLQIRDIKRVLMILFRPGYSWARGKRDARLFFTVARCDGLFEAGWVPCTTVECGC